MATVERRSHPAHPLTAWELAQLKELRNMDGMSSTRVAEIIGCSAGYVRTLAPGRPGKIDNTLIREAFVRSGASATWVAQEIGWVALHGKWNRNRTKRWTWYCGDGSRVRRTLGLIDDVSYKTGRAYRARRTLVDAEHVAMIADAIGVAPWAVGCND